MPESTKHEQHAAFSRNLSFVDFTRDTLVELDPVAMLLEDPPEVCGRATYSSLLLRSSNGFMVAALANFNKRNRNRQLCATAS
mmetsp:Transcript_112614/g.297405  ORF Transcript_112614/g.297405 Transcript_112614/m.297405 type:complete len:83 (-) Transcript_112614:1741-1989(-)